MPAKNPAARPLPDAGAGPVLLAAAALLPPAAATLACPEAALPLANVAASISWTDIVAHPSDVLLPELKPVLLHPAKGAEVSVGEGCRQGGAHEVVRPV